MDTTRTTVPGVGELHDLVTRDGQHVRILVDRSSTRELYLYGEDGASRPIATIVLDQDEADRAAEILHSRSLPDRLADIERRLAELGGAGS